jgi:hypothetical protein
MIPDVLIGKVRGGWRYYPSAKKGGGEGAKTPNILVLINLLFLANWYNKFTYNINGNQLLVKYMLHKIHWKNHHDAR